MTPMHRPLVIVGAGLVGMFTALKLATIGVKSMLCDDSLADNELSQDKRVLAVSIASMMEITQVIKSKSSKLLEQSCYIDGVHISHSGLGTSTILATDVNLPHLGYTISYASLLGILREDLLNNALIEIFPYKIKRIETNDNYSSLAYQQNKDFSPNLHENYLTTDFVIVAEGGAGLLQDVVYQHFDGTHIVLVATISVARYYPNLAFERFSNIGPMAILPIGDNKYSLVWSMKPTQNNDVFDYEFVSSALKQQSFMKRFDEFTLASNITSFPVVVHNVKTRMNKRAVLIGNSAQIVHPISAQGLNLGIRDATTLVGLIARVTTWEDISILANYDDLRKVDVSFVTQFTQSLVNIANNNSWVWNHLKGLGLLSLGGVRLVQNELANSLIFGRMSVI